MFYVIQEATITRRPFFGPSRTLSSMTFFVSTHYQHQTRRRNNDDRRVGGIDLSMSIAVKVRFWVDNSPCYLGESQQQSIIAKT